MFTPTLAAKVNLLVGDWARRDAPDLLWPIVVMGEHGTAGAQRFADWQGAVIADLRDHVPLRDLGDGLDGRLTSLEKLCENEPDRQAVVVDHAERLGMLSTAVRQALSISPSRPAAWLSPTEEGVLGQEGIDLLARSMMDVHGNGHREALVKCVSIWAMVQAGTFSSDLETIELLKLYPYDKATRSQADTVVRASWGAMQGLALDDHDLVARRKDWATSFWIYSSGMTLCVRKRELEDRNSNDENGGGTPDARPDDAEAADSSDDGAHLEQFAKDVMASYIEAVERSPSHLYEREFHEVHVGVVSRIAREVIAALANRDLWCAEHGSHVTRGLVEARIYLAWMDRQEGYDIYREFQEYGFGKAKLYARILDELPEEARMPGFAESVDELEKLSHNGFLDMRSVDTRDSFAGGKSIRSMAEEVDLLDFYRQSYSLTSGITHAEWWSIETHAMERCMNILHGGHLIASMSLNTGGNVQLATSWAGMLHALIDYSLKVQRVDEAALADAFEWLGDPEVDAAFSGQESVE